MEDAMVLRLVCAAIAIKVMVAKAAFTAGAVAGTAGVIGLCALRKAMAERRVDRAGAAAG
jgi:hypothetical protein